MECVKDDPSRKVGAEKIVALPGCIDASASSNSGDRLVADILSPEQVFREHAGGVYRLAWRILGNDADAEDVAQEVLLQVVRRLSTFRGEALLSTWLHRVTVNAALLLRRKRTLRREAPLSEPLMGSLHDERRSSAPGEQLLHDELHDLIERAIASLPAVYRSTYVLADVHGMSNAAVGTMLKLSLPAVKSRRHRARHLMRQALVQYLDVDHE